MFPWFVQTRRRSVCHPVAPQEQIARLRSRPPPALHQSQRLLARLRPSVSPLSSCSRWRRPCRWESRPCRCPSSWTRPWSRPRPPSRCCLGPGPPVPLRTSPSRASTSLWFCPDLTNTRPLASLCELMLDIIPHFYKVGLVRARKKKTLTPVADATSFLFVKFHLEVLVSMRAKRYYSQVLKMKATVWLKNPW